MEIFEAEIDGRAFRALRGTRTQRKMAELLGVSAPTLSNIERGRSKPTGEQLMRALIIANVPAINVVRKDLRDEVLAAVKALQDE